MTQHIKQLHHQAQLAINKAQFKQAHQLLMTILQEDKYYADAYFLLAMIASAYHNISKSIALIKQAMVLAPNQAEYIAQLAKHYALEQNHVKAVEYAKKADEITNKSALTLDTIGVTYSQVGLHHQAVSFFKKAVSLSTDNFIYYFNLGASLKFIGDFSGARTAYQKTLVLNPLYYKAHAALTSLGEISHKHNHIEILTELYEPLQQSDDLLYIGHALAKEYEALENYEKAFYYLNHCKKAKLAQLDYNFSQDFAMFNSIHDVFNDQKTVKQMTAKQGCSSNEALFVVGMPRSGTTLVERILSKHSAVTSAGELQHFGLLLKQLSKTTTNKVIDQETVLSAADIDFFQLGEAYIQSTRALTGKTDKFVDKMPLNVLYAGFILQALPNSKIVCLDRNPLDTIVSNYRQLFSVNYSYYNYAYDLESATKFYIEFKKLTKLWQSLYPDNFYLINYEKLVNTPEKEVKKVLNFCGLDYQAQCLAIEKNSAPVATASAVQVRQPINNKSVGNWKKYQEQLDGATALLNEAGLL